MRRPLILAVSVSARLLTLVAAGIPVLAGAQNAPATPHTTVSRYTPPPLPAGKKAITQDTSTLENPAILDQLKQVL